MVGRDRAMNFNPLAANPLRSRDDVGKAVIALAGGLRGALSPGGARVRLASSGARFDDAAAELEGFTRPLWGLVPLAAGGGRFDGWDRVCAGLANGTDPDHPEVWGLATERDQRLVEMAAIGFALALVPQLVWDPLPARARANLVDWLGAINEVETVDNNWRVFPILVNLGLQRVGGEGRPRKGPEPRGGPHPVYLCEGWGSRWRR